MIKKWKEGALNASMGYGLWCNLRTGKIKWIIMIEEKSAFEKKTWIGHIQCIIVHMHISQEIQKIILIIINIYILICPNKRIWEKSTKNSIDCHLTVSTLGEQSRLYILWFISMK